VLPEVSAAAFDVPSPDVLRTDKENPVHVNDFCGPSTVAVSKKTAPISSTTALTLRTPTAVDSIEGDWTRADVMFAAPEIVAAFNVNLIRDARANIFSRRPMDCVIVLLSIRKEYMVRPSSESMETEMILEVSSLLRERHCIQAVERLTAIALRVMIWSATCAGDKKLMSGGKAPFRSSMDFLLCSASRLASPEWMVEEDEDGTGEELGEDVDDGAGAGAGEGPGEGNPGEGEPGEGEPGEGNVGEGDEGDDEDIDDGAGEGAGEGDPGEGNVGKGDEGDDEGDVDDGESVT
jgi:hypothetical protein